MIPHDWDIDIACGFPDKTKDINSIDKLYKIVVKRLGENKDIKMKKSNTRGICITIPKYGSRTFLSNDNSAYGGGQEYPHVFWMKQAALMITRHSNI
eukprot:UN13900